MVRVGCESAALAPALRQAASVYNLHEPAYRSVIGKLTYCWLMTAFGLLILVFVGLKILPQFAKIFWEFGAPLPAMTQFLFACVDYCGAFLASLDAAAAVVVIPPVVHGRSLRRFDPVGPAGPGTPDACTTALTAGQPTQGSQIT